MDRLGNYESSGSQSENDDLQQPKEPIKRVKPSAPQLAPEVDITQLQVAKV